MKKILLAPDHLLAEFFIGLIKIYQKTISPDHSDLGKTQPLTGCKFYPSCSEYSIQVLQQQGFVLGLPKILGRTLRCHPWSKGGVDFPSNKN
ncbi:membrane protein insertion efficiency factor YidD [Candidatus Gracilibacteria bacterium]|nr:membrane protein insertion efficiency factor YidD [Candidatus Gracilibacteria bacterium]